MVQLAQAGSCPGTGYGGFETLDVHRPIEILVVSDETGSTAEAVVTSALIQFGRANVRVRRLPFTRSVAQVREIVDGVDGPAVVGFSMTLDRQVQVRSERAGRLGARIPGYADRPHIMAEISYCDRVYRSIAGIRTVDVTNRSIEETSDWITHHVL